MMTNDKRYNHFMLSDVPMVAISKTGKILFRNKAALKLSPTLRLGNNIAKYFIPQNAISNCFENSRVSRCHLCLPSHRTVSVSLLSDVGNEDSPLFLILYENPFATNEHSESSSDQATDEVTDQKAVDTFSQMPRCISVELLKQCALSASVFPSAAFLALPFTAEYACMYLNRLSNYLLLPLGITLDAKCTGDCLCFPIPDFPNLMPTVAGLCLLLLELSESDLLTVRIFCEKERMHICISVSEDLSDASAKRTAEKREDRWAELQVMKCVLQMLGWKCTARFSCAQSVFLIVSERILPSSYFSAPSPDFKKLLSSAVDQLLLQVFGYSEHTS